MPSKLFDYCATGRPTILAAAGESRRIAESESAAVVVPPGDPAELASVIKALEGSSELRDRVRRHGPILAAKYLRSAHTTHVESMLGNV